MSFYRAAICEKGHILDVTVGIGAADEELADPEYEASGTDEFCQQCGAPAVTRCARCRLPVRGAPIGNLGKPGNFTEAPRFCYGCGTPYPWQDRGSSGGAGGVVVGPA